MKKPVLILLILLSLTSCVTKKEMIYFQNSSNNNKSTVDYNVTRIQINDILHIIVNSLDAEASSVFSLNTSTSSENSNNNSNNINSIRLFGYLVSPDGEISFPIIGTIKVAGKTVFEVQELIKKAITDNKYLINPTVNVRIINSKITILGEVKSPGTFDYTDQSITLPQALGYAGDLTIFGKRNDILLIRVENGTRTYNKIDLTSKELYDSPFYYIKQNDIIIVNPNYAKMKSAGVIGNIGSILTLLSISITTYLLLKK